MKRQLILQKQSRGESLLEKHQTSKASKKDKEEPPMIWDHARDMGVTGRLLNNEERQAKIRYVPLGSRLFFQYD